MRAARIGAVLIMGSTQMKYARGYCQIITVCAAGSCARLARSLPDRVAPR